MAEFWSSGGKIILISIFTVVYAFAAQRLLLSSMTKRKRRQAKLRATISKGFLNQTIDSVDDLVNIYKGVNQLGADDASYRAGLGKAIREYLVGIIAVDGLEADQTRQLKDTATRLLEQVERETPFADLPAAERNLLLDIHRYVDAGDTELALGKLEDVAGLVEARQDALVKAQNSIRWSVPLAIVGLVLTLVFGLISLFT